MGKFKKKNWIGERFLFKSFIMQLFLLFCHIFRVKCDTCVKFPARYDCLGLAEMRALSNMIWSGEWHSRVEDLPVTRPSFRLHRTLHRTFTEIFPELCIELVFSIWQRSPLMLFQRLIDLAQHKVNEKIKKSRFVKNWKTRSYAVTQLHSVIRFFRCEEGRVMGYIYNYIIYYNI